MEGGGAGGWRPQVWVEVLCVVDGTRRGEQVKGSVGGREHGLDSDNMEKPGGVNEPKA